MPKSIVPHIQLHNSLSQSRLNNIRVLPLFASLLAFLLISVVSANGCSSNNDYHPILPNERPEDKPYNTIIEDFQVVAPSGNNIYGMIRRPDPNLYPDLSFAAVILVAGGINPGRF